MNLLHMTLVQLQILLAIVEAGGFTAAAADLQLSQSAVSHALAALEHELGVTLVERRRSGIRLTVVGERVVAQARIAIHAAEAARQEAAAARGLAAGRVRVGSFPSVSARLLPGVLRAFREHAPGVIVTLFDGTDDEVLHWIRERVVDLGVVTGSQADLLTVPLGEDPFVAVMAADDPFAQQRSISARDLAGEPVILSKGGCEPFIRQFFAEAGVVFAPAYEVRDMPTILAMVREGLGVTLAPRLALPEPADGLRQLPLNPPLVRELALAVPPDMPVAPVTQSFLDETVRWWRTVRAR
jgi:DNA-binding transcriptional LysR family regulator